jgi:hypothetical protein
MFFKGGEDNIGRESNNDGGSNGRFNLAPSTQEPFASSGGGSRFLLQKIQEYGDYLNYENIAPLGS